MAETTLSHISAQENEENLTNKSNVTHCRNIFHTPNQQPMSGQPPSWHVPHENIPAYGLPCHMPSSTPPQRPGPSSSGPNRYPSRVTSHADLHSVTISHGSPDSNFQGLPPPQHLVLKLPSSSLHLGPHQQPQHGHHGLMSKIQDPVLPCQFNFQEQQQEHSCQDGQLAPVPHQSSPTPPHHHPKDKWQTNIPNNGSQQGQAYNSLEHSRMLGSFQQPPPLSSKFGFPLFPSLTSQNTGQSCQRLVNHSQPRLQSYQSCRMRPETKDNKSSDLTHSWNRAWLNGHEHYLDSMSPTMPLCNKFKTEQEEEESQDQEWVRNWVKSRQKPELPKHERSKLDIRLGEIVQLLKDLRKRRDEAEDCLFKDADDGHWENRFWVMKAHMRVLSSLQNDMRSPGFVEQMKKQVEKRQKKRERKRKSREEEWEDREKTLSLYNELVDDSMAKLLQVKQDKEKEEALQKEVDNILAEVHKKKQDVNRTMELLRALSKLRILRKETAEKTGFRGPEDLDVLFEGKVCSLEEMMNRQKLLYVEEERALQVMLEEEHKETRVKEKLENQMKERQQVENAWNEELQLLFGKTDRTELGHQLFMFHQFYMQGENDTQALIDIRRQWDAFHVPKGDPEGSCIPLSWVLPEKPTNYIWKTALKDNLVYD